MKKYYLTFDDNIEKSDPIANGFELIDAKQILAKDIPVNQNTHVARFGFELSQEEIDIARAHIGLWQKFLLSSEDYCLVVEDGVPSNIVKEKRFEDVKYDMEDDWCIYFPYDPLIKRKNNLRTSFPNLTFHEYYNEDPFYLGIEWGTYIYLLSKKGVKILLSEINTICFRIDDMMLMLNASGKLSVSYGDVSFFNLNLINFRPYIERKERIRNTLENLNVWNEEDLSDCRLILKQMAAKAEELNIKLILQGGSHLGYVRHGRVMPWDDDVDLGILEDDLQVFLDNIEETGLCYTKWLTGRKMTIEYYKFWIDNGRRIKLYPYCFPFVDLWVYNIKGDDYCFRGSIVSPNSNKYELVPVDFEGAKLYIVGNSLEVLDARYIDWRSMIRVYNWNHKLENPNRKKLKITIEVDHLGRIIEDI